MENKYETIILHVGLNKTGSTSIQNNCLRYRDLLLQHGVDYGAFEWAGRPLPNHGGPVTAALFGDPGQYGRDWRQVMGANTEQARQAFRQQLNRLLAEPQAPTLVLSGETFSLYQEQDMAQLRDLLLAHTERLRVWVYLRNPLRFVTSVLQQRVRAGRVGAPDQLVMMQRYRYHRLRRCFGEQVEVFNFDQQVASPAGLVGAFMVNCGVPEGALEGLAFGTANTRISLEAFRIMRAINRRYPAGDGGLRQPRDLQALAQLPGTRLDLHEFRDEAVFQRALEDCAWFAENLGLVFDTEVPAPTQRPWRFDTLAVLEQHIRDLRQETLRAAAVDFLREEAAGLEDEPETAAVLGYIARRVAELPHPAPSLVLRELGADYFRAGAQQLRRHSPSLATLLLRVAQEINPDSAEIAEKLQRWQAGGGAAPDGGRPAPLSVADDESDSDKEQAG
jgi:hypothetical protein